MDEATVTLVHARNAEVLSVSAQVINVLYAFAAEIVGGIQKQTAVEVKRPVQSECESIKPGMVAPPNVLQGSLMVP